VADLNHISVIGRLTRDAQFKTLNTGTTLAEFSIANNRGWGDNAKVHYFDVKMWGKGAEALRKYLVKGKAVAVSGELNQERWEGKEGPRSKVVITTFDVQLLSDGKSSEGSSTRSEEYGRPSKDDDSLPSTSDDIDDIAF